MDSNRTFKSRWLTHIPNYQPKAVSKLVGPSSPSPAPPQVPHPPPFPHSPIPYCASIIVVVAPPRAPAAFASGPSPLMGRPCKGTEAVIRLIGAPAGAWPGQAPAARPSWRARHLAYGGALVKRVSACRTCQRSGSVSAAPWSGSLDLALSPPGQPQGWGCCPCAGPTGLLPWDVSA